MNRVTKQKDLSYIITPNHVFDIISSLQSIYQLRIFLIILENLHEYTQLEFNNHLAGRKAMNDIDVLIIHIPLSKISKPSEYRDVKKAIKIMTKIHCQIKFYDLGKLSNWIGTLFNAIIPDQPNHNSTLKIKMDVHVAKLLINFRRNDYKLPSFYSKIDTSIRCTTRFKNVIKLYLYLSLWREKEFREVQLDELCQYLGLPKSYYTTSNFNKHILEPSITVLKEFNDVWIESEKTSIYKNKTGSVMIRLSIMTKDRARIIKAKKDQIIKLLELHFKFNFEDLKEIEPILISAPPHKLLNKISELHTKIKHEKSTVKFVKIALFNEFS